QTPSASVVQPSDVSKWVSVSMTCASRSSITSSESGTGTVGLGYAMSGLHQGKQGEQVILREMHLDLAAERRFRPADEPLGDEDLVLVNVAPARADGVTLGDEVLAGCECHQATSSM